MGNWPNGGNTVWVFSKDGFFSAVENREIKQQVVVRARTKDDIQRLAKVLGVGWRKSDPLADYQFRLDCSKVAWSRYVAKVASEIDYGNFKGAMANIFGVERMHQLHDVWSVMNHSSFDYYDLQPPVAKVNYSDNLKALIAKDAEKARRLAEIDDDLGKPLHGRPGIEGGEL